MLYIVYIYYILYSITTCVSKLAKGSDTQAVGLRFKPIRTIKIGLKILFRSYLI